MATTLTSDLNYIGQLMQMGNNDTVLVRMLGGMGNGAICASQKFACSQPYTVNTRQNPQSENVLMNAGTPTTYTRSQIYNVVSKFKYNVKVSDTKQATPGQYSGIQIVGNQPVGNELTFQQAQAKKQILMDLEYWLFNSTFTDDDGNPATVTSTRGLVQAITAGNNRVAGEGVALTRDKLNALFKSMWDNGVSFAGGNIVLFVNSYQKQLIDDLYGYAPENRNIGGVDIQQIVISFGTVGIITGPFVPTTTVIALNLNNLKVTYLPLEGQILQWTDFPYESAKGGYYRINYGVDYVHADEHGIIDNLLAA